MLFHLGTLFLSEMLTMFCWEKDYTNGAFIIDARGSVKLPFLFFF